MKKILSVAGLVCALASAGCEGMYSEPGSELRLLGIVAGMSAPYADDPRDAAAMDALNRTVTAYGAAEAGRSNVNVFVNPPQQNNFRQPVYRRPSPYPGFACTGARDLNQNGVLDFPEDFIGIGNNFGHEENKLAFYVKLLGKDEPYNISMNMFRGDSFIYTGEIRISMKETGFGHIVNLGSPISSGDWRVEYFIDGELGGVINFNVASPPLGIGGIRRIR